MFLGSLSFSLFLVLSLAVMLEVAWRRLPLVLALPRDCEVANGAVSIIAQYQPVLAFVLRASVWSCRRFVDNSLRFAAACQRLWF